jgi:hypothetical protein
VTAAPGETPAGPPRLRWHVFLWDLWFLVWGVALLLAAVRARRFGSMSVDAEVNG